MIDDVANYHWLI